MALSLNKPNLDNLAGDIWKSAERLRGKFKPYEYQGVILPIIVIRRLECVLLAWREAKSAEVLVRRPRLTEKELAKLVKELELNPRQSPFSNKTDWTLRKVYEEDHTLLEENFRAYINGFSTNVDDIIEHFNYRATIGTMVKNNRLAPILNQYKELALGPDQLSGLEMGYIYEELLRRFSEQSGEEAGDHFTPREVIRLMVELLEIPIPDRHISIYDPACGTGGMLSVAKEHLLDRAATPVQKENVEKFVTIHGHELSPTNYAVCQADLLIKNDQQARVYYGNSLIPHDPHSKEPGDQLPETRIRFDFMLSNPPFGVTWGGKDGYEKEARKLQKTRYQAGMPRVNDGALLFLQTMLGKMQTPEKGGSRIAIIFNGSPLSNGDCGSGESEIRRWILENDWLDAIVMLPDQLFYNTGIFTYIWLLRNEKPASHRGRVMLIDARQQCEKEPKAFSSKRNRMTDAHRQWIEERYHTGWKPGFADEHVKLFRQEDFAFHKVKVVFWQTDEHDQPAIVTEPYEKAFTAANLAKEQAFYDSDLTCRVRVKTDGGEKTVEFSLKPVDSAAKKLKAALGDRPDILSVEWTHRHYVQDDEYIPHGEDLAAFLKREIAKPIIRWEDSPQLGYEILPNKYFYRYQPPTPAKDLLAEFWRLEKDAEKLLEGLAQFETLDALRKSIIQRAVTEGLESGIELRDSGSGVITKLPVGWKLVRLKSIADIRYGLGQPPPEKEDGVPMIRATNVDAGRIIKEDELLHIDPDGLPPDRQPYLNEGEIIVVRSGAYTGDSAIVPGRHAGAVAGYDMVVTVKRAVPEFIGYCLLSEYVLQGQLLLLTLRAAQPHLNAKELGGIVLALPPRQEQEAICAYLDEKLGEVKRIAATIDSQIATLTAYRKALIHECVTGQRRTTEADVTQARRGEAESMRSCR